MDSRSCVAPLTIKYSACRGNVLLLYFSMPYTHVQCRQLQAKSAKVSLSLVNTNQLIILVYFKNKAHYLRNYQLGITLSVLFLIMYVLVEVVFLQVEFRLNKKHKIFAYYIRKHFQQNLCIFSSLKQMCLSLAAVVPPICIQARWCTRHPSPAKPQQQCTHGPRHCTCT